jgi:flagellar hook-associated protein 2
MDAESIATQLRHLANASPSGLSGSVRSLNDLGIASNGSDNTLLVNSTLLDAALGGNLDAVKKLFTDPSGGLAATLNSYLANTTGSNGMLATKEASFTKQSTDIAASITALQQRISLDETRLQNEFVAMEAAISSINTQKQYLTEFFNTSTATTALATGTSSSSSSSSTG